MELVDQVQERKCECIADSWGEKNYALWQQLAGLCILQDYCFSRDFLDTFEKLLQRRKRVKVSIACHFIHLAYIFKKDAKEILICTFLNIALTVKFGACICRALTVL